ncbi:MAG: hypothetical protein Q9M48_04790 [Rhodobacterales bacterium]|nr:hypothetical protein [Rhodobacterales bacterium]
MRSKLGFLWQHHRVTFLAFLAAILVTLFFVIRMAVFTLYWSDPDHRNQPPQDWMTPRYIAFSWGLEPSDVARALGVTPAFGPRPNLEQIARTRGVPLSVLYDELAALLAPTDSLTRAPIKSPDDSSGEVSP